MLAAAPASAHAADRLAVLTIGTPGGPALSDAAAPVSVLQVSPDYSGFGSFTKLPSDSALSGRTNEKGHLTVTPAAVADRGRLPSARGDAPGAVDEDSTSGSSPGSRPTAAWTSRPAWRRVQGQPRRLGSQRRRQSPVGDGRRDPVGRVDRLRRARPPRLDAGSRTRWTHGQFGDGRRREALGRFFASLFPYDTHLYQIGTGLPTSGQQTDTPITVGNPDGEGTTPLQTWGFDFDSTPGIDTIYASGEAGMYKFRLKRRARGSDGRVDRLQRRRDDGELQRRHRAPLHGGAAPRSPRRTTRRRWRSTSAMPAGSSTSPRRSVCSSAASPCCPPRPSRSRASTSALQGLANAIGDPTNASLPRNVTDTLTPNGPFAISSYDAGRHRSPSSTTRCCPPNGFSFKQQHPRTTSRALPTPRGSATPADVADRDDAGRPLGLRLHVLRPRARPPTRLRTLCTAARTPRPATTPAAATPSWPTTSST